MSINRATPQPLLKSLLIYYGWPGKINQAQQTDHPAGAAAREFGRYDYVVLGAGLEKKTHPEHKRTGEILRCPAARQTRFFGYIDLGVSTTHLSLWQIRQRIKAWQKLGVSGIFLDDFGYDFLVSRQRQNRAVAFAHKQGLPVIACGWDPDHLFSPSPEPQCNPRGLASRLNARDYYLYESYQIINGEYADRLSWRNKTAKIHNYQKQLGFQVLAVTTNDAPQPAGQPAEYAEEKFFYAWYSALIDGWEALGWGEPVYSANGTAPWRHRPHLQAGIRLTAKPVETMHTLTRTTDTGLIQINTLTHNYGFELNTGKKTETDK